MMYLALLATLLAMSVGYNIVQQLAIRDLRQRFARCQAYTTAPRDREQRTAAAPIMTPDAELELRKFADEYTSKYMPAAAPEQRHAWKFGATARDPEKNPILGPDPPFPPCKIPYVHGRCERELYSTCVGTPLGCSAMSHATELAGPGGFHSDSSHAFRTALYRVPGGPFGSDEQLHVPVMKPLAFDEPDGEAAPAGTAAAFSMRTRIAPWPERRHPKHVPWGLIPGGPDLVHHCGFDENMSKNFHSRTSSYARAHGGRAYCHHFVAERHDDSPHTAVGDPSVATSGAPSALPLAHTAAA